MTAPILECSFLNTQCQNAGLVDDQCPLWNGLVCSASRDRPRCFWVCPATDAWGSGQTWRSPALCCPVGPLSFIPRQSPTDEPSYHRQIELGSAYVISALHGIGIIVISSETNFPFSRNSHGSVRF